MAETAEPGHSPSRNLIGETYSLSKTPKHGASLTKVDSSNEKLLLGKSPQIQDSSKAILYQQIQPVENESPKEVRQLNADLIGLKT